MGRSDPGEPEAFQGSVSEPKRDYILQIGDVIDIKFYYDSNLNETVTVRPDGKISLQLIGELNAADQIPSELNKIIVNKYSKFLKDPEIIVIVKEFGGQKIYVGGEVMQPGVIGFKGKTTVLQAIVNAGGFKETARQKSIVVISRGKGDTSVTRKIDLRDIISGKANGKEVFVKPFDVIFVHKTLIAEVDKFVDQYIKQVIPVNTTAGFNYGIFKNMVTPIP
jgi:protein involved in polysaccharide export with SLBB domain